MFSAISFTILYVRENCVRDMCLEYASFFSDVLVPRELLTTGTRCLANIEARHFPLGPPKTVIFIYTVIKLLR